MTAGESPGPGGYICAACHHPISEQDLWGGSSEAYPLCDDRNACLERLLENHRRENAAAEAATPDSAPAVAADPGEEGQAPAAGADPDDGEPAEGGSK